MAGRGDRFKNGGFSLPKPLIEFNGKTMIEYAIETLNISGNYIFIVFKYSDESLNLKIKNTLDKLCPGSKIIQIDYITDGPASSALLAQEFINNDEELIITNCDQIMNWKSQDFINYVRKSSFDGVVVTYDSDTAKNSYVSINNYGKATQFAEKQVISKYSLNGIHYWKKGRYFVESSNKMILKDNRVNNEFYISLTYNEMIKEGLDVGIYHIDSDKHNAVGTPEDLELYITKHLS